MNKLIVISGCSAAGKTTLIDKLLAERPGAVRPVTHTTRQPRAGEVDGVHYHFVSRGRFLAMISQNEMIEFAEVHGNLYGTSKKAIQDVPAGTTVVAILDVEGASSMRKAFPECYTVFIDVPENELRRRLIERGDAEADVDRRMMTAAKEKMCRFEFDCIIENVEFDYASRALASVFDRILVSTPEKRSADESKHSVSVGA